MIVAREDGETRFLQGYRKQFTNLRIASNRGPLALVDGKPEAQDILTAAKLVARYSQREFERESIVRIQYVDGASEELSVIPFEPHEVPDQWHVGV